MDKEYVTKENVECVKFTVHYDETKHRHIIDKLREEFEEEYDDGVRHFLVDMGDLDHVNSVFLGAIAFMAERLAKDGKVILFCTNEHIDDIIYIAGFNKLKALEITRIKNTK